MPIDFTRFADIRARPNFDESCVVTLDNYLGLVGHYQLPKLEQQSCHVMRDGKRCGKIHQDGWLVVVAGNKEGLIGGHCARTYFLQHRQFSADRARAEREIKTGNLLARIAAAKEDGSLRKRVDSAKAESGVLRESRNRILGYFSVELQRLLESMDKSGRSDVLVRTLHIEKDESGKEVRKWRPHRLGALNGTRLFRYEESHAVQRDLEAIARVLAMDTSASGNVRKLTKAVKALDSLPRCETGISGMRSALSAFLDPANLRLLCFTSASRPQRVKLAQLAVGRLSGSDCSDAEANRFLDEIDQALETSLGTEFSVR